MSNPIKSSFVKRTLSKEDAIIQILRPQLGNKVSSSMDIFERLVNEAETLTKLGIVITANAQKFYLTPQDLKDNLDEYAEIEQVAIKGRQFLDAVGYVTQRKNAPMPGSAPVGKAVDILPIESQLPGSEPLKGVIVSPKAKQQKPPTE